MNKTNSGNKEEGTVAATVDVSKDNSLRAAVSDFAMSFVRERYGRCPDPNGDPTGEEHWHARVGLLIDALSEYTAKADQPAWQPIETCERSE